MSSTPRHRFDDRTTLDDVRAAYRLLLRREPDPVGLEYFTEAVGQGIGLDEFVGKFTRSLEFKKLSTDRMVWVDLGGYVVRVDPQDPEIGQGVISSRDYEPHVRRAVRERFRAGQTFVDIGANVGCVSFLAARIAGPQGRVVSIEPSSMNLRRLHAGILLNGLTNVRVLPFAASDRRATFSLSGGDTNTHVVEAATTDEQADYAQSIVLDEELAHLDRIDFVKIDIEGHEPFALKGFSALLRKHSPILLTEFNPHCLREVQSMDPKDYLDQILELYTDLKVISSFGDDLESTSSDEIMDYWRKRDRELSSEGIHPSGLLHFDIIATNP
jgi:FkbM family methyltransferase